MGKVNDLYQGLQIIDFANFNVSRSLLGKLCYSMRGSLSNHLFVNFLHLLVKAYGVSFFQLEDRHGDSFENLVRRLVC